MDILKQRHLRVTEDTVVTVLTTLLSKPWSNMAATLLRNPAPWFEVSKTITNATTSDPLLQQKTVK